MRQLIPPAVALSLLMASALASGADNAWQPWIAFDVNAQSSWQAAYGGLTNVSASTPATDEARVRDPIQVFGTAGYYLYDMDAWQAVASGPTVAPLRQRSYSLFGADANSTSLNRLTMGSEAVRRNASGSRWSGSWANPGWSF
jgi:hypothetical protein